MEEYELMKESKYRVYVSAVDKALKNFEYTSEWADLISALGKLNKVLLSHMKFQVIPRRIKISKRLAQCMHPALPSGVHLKALETYDIIFKCMGTSRLSHELFIYSAGLFPLLGHAAMNVRPSLLTVYETHFVPLGERLGPALSGFLSGVLPGLEEGSDHFDRTNSLLEKVCDGVGAARFYTCMWDCLACNSIIRLPAVVFILSHFNKKLSMEDQLHIMGTNVDIMVNGLCAGVQDSSVLVQRSALDLLLVGFPLHNSQLVRSDMVRLVTASLATILRRDMSLNRRLFAWLLGSEVNLSLLSPEHPLIKNSSIPYFELCSRELLIQAIRNSLNQVLVEIPHDLKPYRILVSLLDKPEIGPVILDDILYEVFRTLQLASSDTRMSSDPKRSNSHQPLLQCGSQQELFKSVNLLFSALEPAYIWQYAASLLDKACALPRDNISSNNVHEEVEDIVKHVGCGQPGLLEVCQLVICLLDAVSLESFIDTTCEHLPNLFLHIVTQLTDHSASLTPRQLAMCLLLCSKVLSRVQLQPSAANGSCSNNVSKLRTKSLRRNSDGSQTQTIESNMDRLKDLSQSDHHLASETGLKVETVSRSASVGARIDTGQPPSPPISASPEPEEPLENSVSTKNESQAPPMSSPHPILERCRKQYEEFFVTLVGGPQMVVWGREDYAQLFNRLVVESRIQVEEEQYSGLEMLLKAYLTDGEAVCPPLQRVSQDCDHEARVNCWKSTGCLDTSRQPFSEALQWEQVFHAACSLLVDLSTFPMVSPLSMRQYAQQPPAWLQILVACACWLGRVPSMQLTAISTILDLISVMSGSAPHAAAFNTDSSGNVAVPVVLSPLLEPCHVKFLELNTHVTQVIAHWLWRHLEHGGEIEARCVTLLQQLHDTITSEDVVETAIGEFLCQEDPTSKLIAFQRFANLWHSTRETSNKGKHRPFQKSLLRMLDNLALSDSSPLRLTSQSWLLHALLRGDVSRLLDPLLLPLLAPATARVSVLRVSIQHRSTVLPNDSDSTEARIYAISSEDGNVIYHVSPLQPPDKKKYSSQSDPVRAKRIFTVSTLVKHCSRKKDENTETCRSSLQSWAIPLAANGNPADMDELCRSSSSSSDSTSSTATTLSVSLSDDQQRNSLTGASTPADGEVDSRGVNVTVRGDGRIIVDGPLTKPTFGGFEEGEDEDTPDRAAGRGATPQPSIGECELEESFSAEDYFSSSNFLPRSRAGSTGLSVSNAVVPNDGPGSFLPQTRMIAFQERSRLIQELNLQASSPLTVHPLHSHMLLYCGVYDSGRTLYSLRTLRNALSTNPRTFLSCAATTGVARTSSDLLNVLARHRKSVSGNNFHGELPFGLGGSGRSHMYIEVLLSMCLFYIRSYYPSLGQMRLTSQEIEGNRQVQTASLELLTMVFSELTSIVRDSGKGLANYIADLLSRCKVQKIILHCLVASVHDGANTADSQHGITFTEEIMRFNDPGRPKGEHWEMSPQSEAFQVQLIRLLLALIILEHQIQHKKGDNGSSTSSATNVPTSSQNTPNMADPLQQTSNSSARKPLELKYIAGRPIPQQPMFVASVLSALRLQGDLRRLHQHWTTLVTCALPFMGQSLAHVVLSVVRQLCENLRALAPLYSNTMSASERAVLRLPADYSVTQLEALTILCHYCLLDRSQQPSHALNQPLLSAAGAAGPRGLSAAAAAPSHTAQIFSNLVHVFLTTPLHHDASQENQEPQLAARRALLFNLPQIIASTAVLWQAVMTSSKRDQEWCSVAGSAQVVRHHLLEFLSPISLHHATNFLAAIAVVWQDRRKNISNPAVPVTVSASIVPEQQVLVQLVGAIRVMPIDTLVQTLHQVVKSPPAVHGSSQSTSLEVSALELLLCYLRQGGSPHLLLAESWGSVLALLRDGLQPGLPSQAQFLLLAVLNEFVQRCPSPSERRDLRDLQDITSKLVESCGALAGGCLEQTTWLRRNLAVKENQPPPADSVVTGTNTSAAQCSVQAQMVLAEQLASLLDVTFGSQEKEKVVNILTSLLYNIIPYLRNHSPRNSASFYACSELLASITAFQYTRKAWRRDVLDLLLDPALFQMEARALPHWRAVVDNLMTHDSATFRDLMNRVTQGQGNSLSLFSSREQEYEQRAQLLKRLAFVILCSEMDQYQKYMPEIQERLAESLRLPQVVPAVQANVFLCFRVLLLRMSPHHVTSLWPVIISEMVQVFLQMEQELTTDSDEFRQRNSSHIRLMSGLDLTWVSDRSNGLHARGHPHWLQLQLAAAHLLHLALQLPAHRLPQFQMYRWAFVGSVDSVGLNNNDSGVVLSTLGLTSLSEEDASAVSRFVPHITRIARLMDTKYEGPVELPAGCTLLPGTQMVRCLQELHPFFAALSTSGAHAVSGVADSPKALADLERAIEADFLESMPSR